MLVCAGTLFTNGYTAFFPITINCSFVFFNERENVRILNIVHDFVVFVGIFSVSVFRCFRTVSCSTPVVAVFSIVAIRCRYVKNLLMM